MWRAVSGTLSPHDRAVAASIAARRPESFKEDTIRFVILAAGVGSRLGQDIPKALVELEPGYRILDHQLENIARFADPADVTVVTGYKADELTAAFPSVRTVHNPRFAETNTGVSLRMALESFDEPEDVIWLNGDVVFDGAILDRVVARDGENVVCVNVARCGEEEVKYATDEDGRITAISKQVDQALGEALGINRVAAADVPAFIAELHRIGDRDYFEKAMEQSISAGVVWRPEDVTDHFCVEIDFQEDLERAIEYIRAYARNR